VINSDETLSDAGWINVGDDAYFTKQFITALARFDGDVLFHMQGDGSYANWQGVIIGRFRPLMSTDGASLLLMSTILFTILPKSGLIVSSARTWNLVLFPARTARAGSFIRM
jgi:hypothetical protein